MCSQKACPAKRPTMVKPDAEPRWYGKPAKRVMSRHEPHITGWLYGESLDGDAIVQWDDDIVMLLPVAMDELVILA